MRPPSGTFAREPVERLRTRVLAPEHPVDVHARQQALGAQRAPTSAGEQRRALQRRRERDDAVAGEDAEHRVRGQQPAAEEAPLRAHEEVEEDGNASSSSASRQSRRIATTAPPTAAASGSQPRPQPSVPT